MALVRTQILTLLGRIDPTYKTMALITSADVGTASTGWMAIGGDKFQAQEVVDFYNQARMQLASVLERTLPPDKKAASVSGNIVKGSLAFSSGTITKPTGYVMWERLENPSALQVTILPVSQIQQAKDLISATNLMVFDYGASFTAYDGTTTIANGTYPFYYYGVTLYTTTTATDASTVESFNEFYHPILIELAVALARGQGSAEVDMMALKFIGGA